MKNANIRILIILAIITLFGIISTQVYWVSRAVDQQDRVFLYNVQVALRNVVESLCETNGKEFPSQNPIEQVSENYFIVKTNDHIDLETLEYLITAEIRKRAITQDFEYGVYDCQNDKMVYADNVNLTDTQQKRLFPTLDKEEYYFGVYFPDKSKTIIGGLDFWKFTTGLTIVVILFFGYGLSVILKQKRLSEVQRDFINNVTHELKTPLSTLSLATDTLVERFPEEAGNYVNIIQQETNRLKSHIDKILHSSLLEARRPAKKEKILLNLFLSDLLQKIKKQYQRNMIEWELKVTGGIMQANKSLFENVMRNLIDNAIKYGGSKVQICVKNGKDIEVSVQDNGSGIPRDHQTKIFDKFYRVPDDENQHNVKGFGLGLYIVKQAIKKMGGKIRLKSEEGVGSTFIISLPHG